MNTTIHASFCHWKNNAIHLLYVQDHVSTTVMKHQNKEQKLVGQNYNVNIAVEIHVIRERAFAAL